MNVKHGKLGYLKLATSFCILMCCAVMLLVVGVNEHVMDAKCQVDSRFKKIQDSRFRQCSVDGHIKTTTRNVWTKAVVFCLASLLHDLYHHVRHQKTKDHRTTDQWP